MSGTDPEETMPFTHRPYGTDEPVDPVTSPEGSSTQDSGTAYVSPSGAPPSTPTTPYETPQYGAPQYGAPLADQPPPVAWGPAYAGYPAYTGHLRHKGAGTARTLGIVSLVSAGVALLCCVTLPGVFCAPFAWVIGVRARNEIDANPGVYGNRGEAQAGVVMGIIGTIISVLTVAAVVVVVLALASMNWTIV